MVDVMKLQLIKPAVKKGRNSFKGDLKMEPNTKPMQAIMMAVDNVIQNGPRVERLYVNFQRFPTLDAKKLVNAPKMSAHHRGICHF